MMVYGFWFFLFFVGWFLFWVIVYWKAVGFLFLKLPGMSTIIYLAVLGGAFGLAFLFGWLIGLPPESRSAVLWVLFACCLIGVPSVLYLLWKRRRWEVGITANEIRAKVEGAKRRLERDPKDWGALLVLAKTYEKQSRFEEAIEAYSNALSFMGGTAIRSKTEAQLGFLKGQVEKKKAEMTLVCSQCGSKNTPNDRACSNCQAPLYRTLLHWILANLDQKVKYALLGIVVLFSMFFFWVNPVFVIVLILLWCFDIIYFSLPVEFKGGEL